MKPAQFIAGSMICSFIVMASFSACSNQESRSTPAPVVKRDSSESAAVPEEAPAVPNFSYHFISYRNKDKAIRDSAKAYMKSLSPAERDIVLRLNRVDAASYTRLDTMIVPDRIDTSWMAYSLFPTEIPALKDVRKMVFFAYYPEAFAAYEAGRLVKWGPSNMGKKATPTPTGLFSANWKAKEAISTVDNDWKLKWNFNVHNKGGVGWHQYQLPGYPASHSCMRLLESDAFWLYNWADMWILKDNLLAAQGTPVIIFGSYPFGKSKPWWSMVQDGAALDIPADTMDAIIQPHLAKILARQAQRDSVLQSMPRKPQKEGADMTTAQL